MAYYCGGEVPCTRELPTVHFDDLNLAQATRSWPVMVRSHDVRETGELCRLESDFVLTGPSGVTISPLTGLNLRLNECFSLAGADCQGFTWPSERRRPSRYPGISAGGRSRRKLGGMVQLRCRRLTQRERLRAQPAGWPLPWWEHVPAEQGLDGQCGGTESDGVRSEVAKLDRGLGE